MENLTSQGGARWAAKSATALHILDAEALDYCFLNTVHTLLIRYSLAAGAEITLTRHSSVTTNGQFIALRTKHALSHMSSGGMQTSVAP